MRHHDPDTHSMNAAADGLGPVEGLLGRLGGEIASRQASVPLSPGAGGRLRARLAALEKPPSRRESLLGRLAEVLGALRAPRFAMAGAAFAAVVGAAVFLASERGGSAASAPGELTFREGSFAMAPADGVLRPGTIVATEADSGALLELGRVIDGDRRVQILLAEASEIVVWSDQRVELRKGALWADIVTNSGPFEVATPHGGASVMGTTFGIEVDGGASNLAVAKGRVKLASASGGNALVDAGHRSAIESGAVQPVLAAEVGMPAWAKEIQLAALRDRFRYFPSARPVAAP